MSPRPPPVSSRFETPTPPLEVLDLLIDRVRTVPLLVVLTHRPEFPRWSEQGHVGA